MRHKHKKNGSVRFSYACAYAYVAGVLTCFSGASASASAYAYVLVKTRLYCVMSISKYNVKKFGKFGSDFLEVT